MTVRVKIMKRLICLLFSVLSLTVLTACHKKPSADIQTPNGVYTGTLPCEGCSGIDTAVTFNPDGTVVKSMLYEGSDKPFSTETGQWKMDDKGKATAVFPSGKTRFQVEPETVELLDGNGKPHPADTGKYILRKLRPRDSVFFAGNWFLDGDEGEGYRQIMKIRGETANDVIVDIRFSGARKGCRFHSKGHISDGQIEIPLNNAEAGMNGTLIIRPSRENGILTLSTLNPEDRNELIYFCGGGGSLAGDYKKAH